MLLCQQQTSPLCSTVGGQLHGRDRLQSERR